MVAAALMALAISAPAASAATPSPEPSPSRPVLTEVQIDQITCSGAHISQTGLPIGHRFEVVISDPAPTTKELASTVVRSDITGSIDLYLSFQVGDARRLHVEVEDLEKDAEYGETGTDLTIRCAKDGSRPWWVAGVAVLVVVVAGLAVVRRRRRAA